jgi:hypothetical protein
MFALRGPGQGSVAIDKTKRTAFITDLGKSGDGDKVTLDGLPLMDRLSDLKIRNLVVTCSHPHSDHMGGIRALFAKPEAFFTDYTMATPRFESITVIDNGVTDSLETILRQSLSGNRALKISYRSAAKTNAFKGLADPGDDVFVENIPYTPSDKPGPHGRSIITRTKLGQGHSSVDFDDADSTVIAKVVNEMISQGTTEIDSFVVPHHGSAYHDLEPILKLNPKQAIITVNPRNPYGHPSPAILLMLIEKLKPENVLFTGSADHLVMDPSGIKQARYTAANPESYELFVERNYERSLARHNPEEVALFKLIKEKMVPGPEPSIVVARLSSQERSRQLLLDQVRWEIESAEQANRELLTLSNTLALGAAAVSIETQGTLQKSLALQRQILNHLSGYLQEHKDDTDAGFGHEQKRLEELARQIRHSLAPAAPSPSPDHPFRDDGLRTLKADVQSGIEKLNTRTRRVLREAREVTTVAYVASTATARTGTPVISAFKPHPPCQH